ncbi:MAG: EamA family transporter [Ruminococcaceae bacterium]|nr:EamA family transporter [Oscillospiraceae bacterium]
MRSINLPKKAARSRCNDNQVMNTQRKTQSPFSVFMILLAAVLWGTTGVFMTFLREAGFSPMQIVFLRSSLSTVLLGLFLLISDRSKFRFKLKDIWIFVGTGIVSLMTYTIFNQIAIKLCTLSIASALVYTSPAFILIMSAILFREKMTGGKITAIIVTICGCFLVSGVLTPGAVISLPGIAAGVASGFCYGMYSIFGRYGVAKYDSMTVTFYTFLFVTIASFPMSEIASMPSILRESPNAIPLVIFFGPITCLAPYLAYTVGLRGTESGTAGILATLEPVVSTILSILIFHEIMTWQKVLGIVLILGSVLIVNVRIPHRKNDPNKLIT